MHLCVPCIHIQIAPCVLLLLPVFSLLPRALLPLDVFSLLLRVLRVRLLRIRLLLDLDPYGGSEPLGMVPIFLKRTADVLAPRFSVVFWHLVRLGSFPACWRDANVTPIPNGPPSSSVACPRCLNA